METFINYLWFFVIYSFLGWVVEVSFQTIKKKTFINRGFLNGPYCSIYGIGMSFIIFIFSPFDNLLLLFLGSAFLTTVLEYITGYLLEKLFSEKWWDYSKEPFNIHGYVALFFSLRWGIGVVFTVVFIHPFILFIVNHSHNLIGYIFLSLILISIFADFVVTIFELLNIKRHYNTLNDIVYKLEKYSDQIGINIYEKISSAKVTKENISDLFEEPKESLLLILEKYDLLKDKKSYIQNRLEKAYPNLLKKNKKES